jgi:hypothetical protein
VDCGGDRRFLGDVRALGLSRRSMGGGGFIDRSWCTGSRYYYAGGRSEGSQVRSTDVQTLVSLGVLVWWITALGYRLLVMIEIICRRKRV